MLPQTVLDGTFVAPLYALEKMFCASLLLLCSLLSSSMLFFLFSARFATILASFWSPWDLKNIAFFIERVSKFKLVAIFALDAALGPQNHPKTLQISVPSPPKGTPEEPRSAQERPRRDPKPPKTTPRELSGYPWASKNSPGVVLGASGPHFGAPRASFT